MARRVGLTRANRGEVQRLADDGHGRNSISRELGVSRAAVDEAATELGINWSRAQTAKATKARLHDARHELSETLSDVSAVAARRLLQELESDDIDPARVRALAQAAGIASDRVINLADRVGIDDADTEEPKTLLRDFISAIELKYSADGMGDDLARATHSPDHPGHPDHPDHTTTERGTHHV